MSLKPFLNRTQPKKTNWHTVLDYLQEEPAKAVNGINENIPDVIGNRIVSKVMCNLWVQED